MIRAKKNNYEGNEGWQFIENDMTDVDQLPSMTQGLGFHFLSYI